MIPAELTTPCPTCRADIGVNCLPPGPRTYHRARQMAVGTAPEQAVAE